MKKLFATISLVLAALAAGAAFVGVGTGTASRWGLYAGAGTGAKLSEYDTFDACKAAAVAQATKASTYTCKASGTITVTAQVPPKPADDTQTVACVAPTVGSWTQTRTYTLANNVWVAGAWTPSTAPAGACTTPAASQPAQCAAMPGSQMPVIDCTKIPAPNKGKDDSGQQLPYTTAMRRAVGGEPGPSANDIGAFREACSYSHINFDDPLLFPGQPGKSHSHVYFGNTAADASLTASNILSAPSSTCAGGLLNRSAYWAPVVVDTSTGVPLTPSGSLFYYKTGYNGTVPAQIKPFPAGLRMIAGDSKSTAPQAVIKYVCNDGQNDGAWSDGIPNCPAGNRLKMEVSFPQCWDGVNLDSPGHQSHMAYPGGEGPLAGTKGCPATHPVQLPILSFEIHYPITKTYAPNTLRLSSDNYASTQPGGYSGHGDYIMGWDPAVMQAFVTNCLNKSLDCHAYLLGDGTTLY